MKVAHILPSLAHAGPILISKSIVDELISVIDIDVLYFTDLVETNFKANIEKIKLNRKIEFNKYDIIHTHMLRPDFYIFFWSFLGYCKSPIKISTVHQFIDHDQSIQHHFLKANIVSNVWHLALNMFDAIVTLNQLMCDDYQLKYPKKDVIKIHNGIEDIEVSEKIPCSDIEIIKKFKGNKVCLGSAAQITKNKGFDQIVKLLAKNKRLCFILIGEGDNLNKLKTIANQNNTSDQILFMGKRNNAKKYFKFFDIFIMSSEKEGFPVSLLEAASLSIPSIFNKNKIFENIFNQKEVSFFEQNNIDSLNVAVQRILNDKLAYSININKRFKNNYTSKIMASNYLNLYNDLIIKRSSFGTN